MLLAQLAEYLYAPTDYILINHFFTAAEVAAYAPGPATALAGWKENATCVGNAGPVSSPQAARSPTKIKGTPTLTELMPPPF